jgi:flavin reductase (DIM6/NTAB) family NADH-FMN oxidoreductase RutF
MRAISSGLSVWKQIFTGRAGTSNGALHADPTAFRNMMREVAAPVAIIAAGQVGHRNGLTATAVCSVSDTPPTMLVCVRRNANPRDLIANSGFFSINFLSAEQEDIAIRFSGSTGVWGEDRFSTGDWRNGTSGVPVLPNSLCTLECKLVGTQAVATHTIFFGELVDGKARESGHGLLYRRGRYLALPNVSGGWWEAKSHCDQDQFASRADCRNTEQKPFNPIQLQEQSVREQNDH